MEWHIVTPVSRPQNIERIYQSILTSLEGIDWRWWLVLDLRHVSTLTFAAPGMRVLGCHGSGIAGHCCRNTADKHIKGDGMVWQLDDDTIVHPNLGAIIKRIPERTEAAFWEMARKDGTRYAGPAGPMDTGCGAIHRGYISPWREDVYDADQHYFRAHLAMIGMDNVAVFNEYGAYYNYLR